MVTILLNFLLLVMLISSIKLPIPTVRCESTENAPAALSDKNRQDEINAEMALLREVFYKGLIEDFRAEGMTGDVDISPELETMMDDRIRGFLRAADGSDRTPVRPKRESKSDDDGVGGERFFLKGFRERGFVPVNFPLDICLLKVGNTVFAASLHIRKSKESYANHTVVSFYVRDKGQFQKYKEYTAILARNFDCISHASLGFVAVVNYYDNAQHQESPQTHRSFEDGSPVFQIQENGTTEIVQKFSQSNQHTVHMWIHGNQVYLTHTYTNLDESVANVCPLYRWSGLHFDAIDELPCYNSIHIESFTIAETLFIAIANQMNDEAVDEDTFSDIFKFNYEQQKFEFHQKIYVYSVSDIAYFFLDQGDVREHFLVTGNSRAGKKIKGRLDYDQHSIVYKFSEGYFVPFQKFELHRVRKFMPVMRENGEFLLLIQCRGKPLQIYEYDGWKFAPSRIDYTREAFAVGVSHMRVYRHMINASLIVIANKNLFGTVANIFSPIYGVENNLKEVYEQFVNWCGETTDRLSKLNLQEVYNKLAALPSIGKESLKITKGIEIKGSTVGQLHAGSVHLDGFVLDQRTFDYLNNVHDQLEELKKKAQKLKSIIDDSLQLNETLEVRGDLRAPQVIASGGLVREVNAAKINDEQQPARSAAEQGEIINVDKLIVDEKLAVQFLNGFASETLLHTDDDLRALKDVDVYASEIQVKGEVFVNNLVDGVRFTPDNIVIRGMDQVFKGKTLHADHLVVGNLRTPSLNSTDVREFTSLIRQASKVKARSKNRKSKDYPTRLREIRVSDLELSGLLNDVDINYIDKHALKIAGDQVITAPFHFDNIVADKVVTPNNRLSGIDLNLLVLTEPTSETPDYKVRQDVQFLNGVYMDNIQLYDRINHIPVIDDQLQVLLMNSEEPQLITGTKTFDNVELLGPIMLQGKINSSSLSKMNPVTTIARDIYLEGDFEITGNVTIDRLLNATNIYGASRSYNFVDLYEHGLPLTAVASYQNFTFKKPLIVENAFSNNLNGLNPSDFIPATSDKIQRITGTKTFTGDLTIRGGYFDAAVINKVDLRQLNNTILKRSGDQVIEGDIHFKEIVATSVVSQQSYFEDRPLQTLLNAGNEQDIKSRIRLENCKVTVGGGLYVHNLETYNGSTVYGYDLDAMFEDSLMRGQEMASVTGAKTFHNLTVGELVLLDQASLNGVDMAGLKKLSNPFEKTVVVEETLILKHPIRVRNVFFNGSINGVSKQDFGRSWLLNEYNQTFTAPQIFENVIVDHAFVDGYVNGVKLDELMNNVYFLDRNERVERAVFHDGIVSYQPVMVNGLVSGLNLATDVLHSHSPEQQRVREIHIDGNVQVAGGIHVTGTLNGMNYAKLRELTSNPNPEYPLNLEVHGTVHYEFQPEIGQLNGYSLEHLHQDVWLTNRDEVLTGKYHFENVHFENYVHLKGPVNNLDLDEIAGTYLEHSLTEPQFVSTPLIIKGRCEFRNLARFDNVTLKGLLKGSPESSGIDIVDFDKHVLKNDVTQTITGKWVFHELEVRGDLSLTTINGLDLRKDILLNSSTSDAVVTAPKRFDSLRVRNINCKKPCIIQGVDFGEWFTRSVRLSRNHTIEGVTTLESATVLGDVESLGPVNNITFDKDHLLLKSIPQNITGDLYVYTKFPEQNLIYPSSIEELAVETINGKNFNQFMKNLARSDQQTLTIKTPVTFAQTLDVENLNTGNNSMYGVNINHLLQDVEYGDQLHKYESKLRSLHTVGQTLVDTFNTKTPYLDQFYRIKALPGRFRSVAVISLPLSPNNVELLAAHADDGNRTAVEFYRWNNKDAQFRVAKGFVPITSPSLAISKLKRITLGHVQHLFVEFYDLSGHFYRQAILDLEPPDFTVPKKTPKFVTIYEFNSSIPMDIVALKLRDLDCIGLHSPLAEGLQVHCVHLENLMYYMRPQQTLLTAPIYQASYIDGRLVLLGQDNKLQIWRPQPNYQLSLHQLIELHQPTFITTTKFDHQLFIAVNSGFDPTSEGTSAHHGSVQIWRDQRPRHRNGTFTRYQTIPTKATRQARFSVLPSVGELMLYTLNDDPFQPLVIYRYEGVAGFREYLTSNVLRLNDRPRLEVVKLNGRERELLALVREREVMFIEGALKGTP